MREIKFRTLSPEMIEVRPTDTKTKGKCTLLLYQTARCPMEILDEAFPGAWVCDYKEVAGDVYCGIGIKLDDEWVWRWNAGVEGNIGEGKSRASDAFKRAATMWGIGRELYYTPKVKIDCPDNYYWNDKMTMTFTVKDISWDNKECTNLVIVDRFGNEVYAFSKERQPNPKKGYKPKEEPKCNCDILKTWCGEKKKEPGIDKDELLKFYNYYCGVVSKWTNELKPEILWERWLKTKR